MPRIDPPMVRPKNKGEIIIGGENDGPPVLLPVGSEGKVLTATSGSPAWLEPVTEVHVGNDEPEGADTGAVWFNPDGGTGYSLTDVIERVDVSINEDGTIKDEAVTASPTIADHEMRISRVDPGVAPSASVSLRGRPTAAYWGASDGVFPNDHGGRNDGITDNAQAFADAVAEAMDQSVPLLLAGNGGFSSAGYITSQPIVLPRIGNNTRNKAVPVIGMGPSDTWIRGSSDFPENRGIIEWEPVVARVYNARIEGIRILLPNVAGVKGIYHKVAGAATTLSGVMAEWLHCDMIDLTFEGHNDYHEVFIDLEIGNRASRMVNLKGDPARATGNGVQPPYATVLVRTASQYGSTIPGAHEDSVGLSYCEMNGWWSNMIRGGHSRLFEGRIMGRGFEGGFVNGGLYHQGDSVKLVNSGNAFISGLGSEGWGEAASYRLVNANGVTVDGGVIGVPDLPGGGPYPKWTASTAVTVGHERTPTALSGNAVTSSNKYFRVIVAGTTGSTEPVWPDTIGATVVDGTVTWEAIGQALGDMIVVEGSRNVTWRGRTAQPGSPVVGNRGVKAVRIDANSSDVHFVDFDVRVQTHDSVANEFEVLGTRCSISGRSLSGPLASTTYRPYSVGGPAVLRGDGNPEGVIVGSPGSTFQSSDGNVYRKASGTGMTGWVTT